jgi:hypothetical protein
MFTRLSTFGPQKKEMLLAKLRRELLISDQRHGRMREMIEEGTQLRERCTCPPLMPESPWCCSIIT